MELTLGVRDACSGARADAVVQAPAGTRLEEVLPLLAAQVGKCPTTGRVQVAGVDVPVETLLGAPPLVHGALVEFATGAGRFAWQPRPHLPTLQVLAGPQTGTVLPIDGVPIHIGRDADCELVLHDDDVSRWHCRLELLPEHGPAHVQVTDLDSTNGTLLSGKLLDGPALLPSGALLQLGSCTLTLAPPAGPAVRLTPTGDGGLAYARPPRVRPEQPVVQVVVPHPPTAGERASIPLLALLGPLVLGVVMWRLTGAVTFLLFTLLSPVLMLGQLVSERRSGRRRGRREQALWRAQRQTAEQVLHEAVAADEGRRLREHPSGAAVQLTARGPGPRLWERRRADGDLLCVRLGLADQPAEVEAEGDLAQLCTTARAVPVVVDLQAVGVLGIAGPGANGLARSVIVQAATAVSPRDLSVVVLAADGREAAEAWSWTRWLPHARPDSGQDCRALLGFGHRQAAARVAELDALLDDRVADPSPDTPPRAVLLLVDGARALRTVPGLRRLLTEGPRFSIYAVCLDAVGALPEECGAVAELYDAGPPRNTPHSNQPHSAALRLTRHGRPDLNGAVPDRLRVELAEAAARALAPLRDTSRDRSGNDGLPGQVRWTDLVALSLGDGDGDPVIGEPPARAQADGDGLDAERVAERWRGAGRSTEVLLGRSADGPFTVDLAVDGPHALVAGTTGAGKSELLQTLVASLALTNRPDALTFVLVDYKGGAAFGPCADLPHTVGLVTDLDGPLVERALASLAAELTRRERVLQEVGAKDLEDHRIGVGVARALARLVIVVDEFASLAEELPDFVTGLVGIAQRGRSLGVHLVLATQRPEGVVSPEIRANTNLRLCLAVTGEHESRDVLNSPLAARISRATPGRGLARTGPSTLTAFQTARVGGRRPPRNEHASIDVRVCPAAELGAPLRPRSAPPKAGSSVLADDATDLDLLVRACRRAADQLALAPGARPWLPPLPELVCREDLPGQVEPGQVEATTGTDRHPIDAAVPPLAYGLVDVPAAQTQRPLVLDLEATNHLLVLGAPRSGRTTVLRTLAAAIATLPAEDVHLYAIDCGGALGPLTELPHTGAVVARTEPGRVSRLLRWLAEELVRRGDTLASGGFGGIAEQRAASAPEDRLPRLVLLLDRWEAFLASFQDVDSGRLVDLVLQLLQDGPAAGLHLVVTADRTGLVGRLGSLIDSRVLLRLADPGDYLAAGVPTRSVPQHLPPGRGWLLDGASLSCQIAVLGVDSSGDGQHGRPDVTAPGQTRALTALARLAPAAVHHRPHRLRALPTTLSRTEISTPTPPGHLLLGVAGDELGPALLDITSAGGVLVAGPPGSGRSTTLSTLAHSIHEQGGTVLAVTPRPSPLRELAWLTGCLTGSEPASELDRLLVPSGPGQQALLLDDVELLTDSALAPLLEQLVARARDTGLLVVAAGTTSDLLTAYRGLTVDLRRSRTGVLLHPTSPVDGDLFGLRLSTAEFSSSPAPPGRGLLVQRSSAVPLQIAQSRPVARATGVEPPDRGNASNDRSRRGHAHG